MKLSQQAVLADVSLSHNAATVRDADVRQSAASPPRLPAADILRGLAALWVFLFHANAGHHVDGLARGLPDTLSSALFSAGHLGVAVFFVLSGMVIAMSGQHCGDSMAQAGKFVGRRLVRLAPPYYFSLLIVIAFLLLKKNVEGAASPLPAPGAIAAHLVFLQNILGIQSLNSVYWTLCIEVQFYFAFCALMLLSHWLGRGRLAGHAWMTVMGAACAVAALWPLKLADSGVWQASFFPTWHLFLLGVLLYHARKRTRRAQAPYVVYLCLLAVAAGLSGDAFTLAGLATSMVLYGLSRWPMKSAWQHVRLLTHFGMISYSFYLLHNPITGAAFNIARRLAGSGVAAELAGLALSLCLCVLAAGGMYALVERPAIRLGRLFRN